MVKSQFDPDVMPKIHAICAGETDHVTLMAVIAGELFHAVDGFDGLGFTGWWHRACQSWGLIRAGMAV